MTTLTMRRIKDDFIATGPDIEPAKFKSRRDAKDWCAQHYPGSPIYEIERLIPAKIPGHAAERAFAPKGPRSAKMRNPASRNWGRSWKRWTETKWRPLLKKRTPATSYA